MSLHQSLVLLHVIATGGLFAGLGIEVAAHRRIQRTSDVAEARIWLPSLHRPGGMLPHLSMVTLILTGLGLAAQRGSLAAWMTAALVAIVLMIVLTVALGGAALSRLATSLGTEGDQTTADWLVHARDAGLHWSLWLRVGLYLGVLGLMVLKPGSIGSIATVAVGVAAGATVAVASRPRQDTLLRAG